MEAIEAIVVFGEDGEETRLGELWAEQPVVFVFVRHFG